MKTFIDKLAFIHIKDQKILVTLSKGKDTWYIPGGKREEGESDKEALIREVKEELGVDLLPETIQKHGVFQAQAHGKPEGTMVRLTCYAADFNGEPKPLAEIAQRDDFDSSQADQTSGSSQLLISDLVKKGLIQ